MAASFPLWATAIPLGLALGIVLQRSGFCIMGALSDALLFGSLRRLRILALALATALLATTLAAFAGLLPVGERLLYLRDRGDPLTLLLGGLAFGIGMVLAGGCMSRSLARSAEGDGRSTLVLITAGLTAMAAAALLPPHLLPGDLTSLAGWRLTVLPPGSVATLSVGLLAATGLALWALREPRLRASGPLATGIGLGAIVVLAWLASGNLRLDASESPAAVNLILPWVTTSAQLLNGVDPPGFGLVLCGAGWLGACGSALATGRWRRAWFRDAADLRRHLLGAVLMGLGGGAMLGCTLGHGLAGLAILAPASVLACAGMVAGAQLGLRSLERGRLFGLRLAL